MNNSSPVATSAASGGVVGALTVLIVYVLQEFAHVTVPAEVAASLMVILTPIVHAIAVRIGAEPADKPKKDATP